MTIVVEQVSLESTNDYADFVGSCSVSLLYHSPEYLQILATILTESELIILAASKGGRIIGTLAGFVRRSDEGTVLNSLPYFGSHGDVLVADTEVDQVAVVSAIALKLREFCRERSIGAINIVAHPLSPQIERFADLLDLKAWDHRIGQISRLPTASAHEVALEGVLKACHQKTRNLVRKGLRNGFSLEVSEADADWQSLMLHHRIGMQRIGGRPKDAREFAAIRAVLEPRGACRLYVARRDGAFAGGLLNLYCRDWVEYFAPVIVEEFRNEQVLSALIASSMCDAILADKRFWNWGGTWSTQASVHHFKKGWGAVDHVYHYWGAVNDPRLVAMEPSECSERYPFFYVRPFQR